MVCLVTGGYCGCTWAFDWSLKLEHIYMGERGKWRAVSLYLDGDSPAAFTDSG